MPLAREWQMDYDMSMDASDAYRFYNPFSIAKGIRMLGSTAQYGYFGEISSALQEDTAGVCYSIPLVVGDGADYRYSGRNHDQGADLCAFKK